jgi:hypothetical protein
LHQPFALIEPATLVQEDGATNSLQFPQRWLPFGELRYPTDACDIFAAEAGYVVAKMIGVAARAQVTPCKTERLEMLADQVFWLSAMSMIPPNQRFKSPPHRRINPSDLLTLAMRWRR